jgi:septal ring factor EnvC (AmiA/AmiB activator)
MKKLIFILSVVVLASCGHKKEIARMQSKQDSISNVGVQKDNTILEYIGAMNQIQMNLDSIKTLEKMVSVQTAPGVEMKEEAKTRILEDIALINNLLQKNKELVKSLQSKLRSSNQRIVELEKMIELLNKQISEKDDEIAGLKGQLEKLNFDVASLNQKIETITQESEQTIKAKEETINTQTSELNTAYYAFGTKKELEEKNVIEKEGGVLGMGKTIQLKKDFNRDFFMKIDIREFTQLPLNTKKAKMVTVHPLGTYHFMGNDKKVEGLVIDKPEEFWKASKYLLLVVE